MNLFGGSPGLQILERQVERGILDVFSEIDRMGGVLPAMEQRFQRSQIQDAAHALGTPEESDPLAQGRGHPAAGRLWKLAVAIHVKRTAPRTKAGRDADTFPAPGADS